MPFKKGDIIAAQTATYKNYSLTTG